WDADKRTREDSHRGRRGGGRYHRGMYGAVAGSSRRHKTIEKAETVEDASSPPEQKQQENEANGDRGSSTVDGAEAQASPKVSDEGQKEEAAGDASPGDPEQSQPIADGDSISPTEETWA